MLVITRTKTYLKDSKKTSLSDKHFTKLVNYLSLLSQQEPLPEEAKDHSLKGEWGAYREFHVSGDECFFQYLEKAITSRRLLG